MFRKYTLNTKKKISTIKLTINDYISKGVSKLRVYEL